MSAIDQDTCRKAAAECVELARVTPDPEKKEILLLRAQEWLKLAYSKSESEFEALLSQHNSRQMGDMRPQRQPMQQQQSKARPEE